MIRFFGRGLCQRLDRNRNGPRQISSLGRDQGRVHRIQKHHGGTIVGGQRTLHKGVAGKGDQSDPVSLESLNQAANLDPGALHAIGHKIFGVHRIGDIQGNDQILSLPLQHFNAVAELGTRKCKTQKTHRKEHKRHLPAQRRLVHRIAQTPHKGMVAEATEKNAPAMGRKAVQNSQQGKQGQGPQPRDSAKAKHQGSVLSQVRPNTTSSRRTSSPATSGIAKRSP